MKNDIDPDVSGGGVGHGGKVGYMAGGKVGVRVTVQVLGCDRNLHCMAHAVTQVFSASL